MSGTIIVNRNMETMSTAQSIRVTPRATAATAPSTRALQRNRHGSQAYYWTREWQQGERLADLDILVGDVYKPRDVPALLEWLHS